MEYVDAEFAGYVYDLLAQHCGAKESMRGHFVHMYQTHALNEDRWGCFEYRFQGELGYGGKYYDTGRQQFVSCYQEDETPERRAAIDAVNADLAKRVK